MRTKSPPPARAVHPAPGAARTKDAGSRWVDAARAPYDASAPRICAAELAGEPLALPTADASPDISRTNLESWVRLLAGPELKGREAGTNDSKRAARLLADHFLAVGALGPIAGGYCQLFAASGISDQNVVAHVPPVGDAGRCGWVVVGAHYDALGVDSKGRVRPGADDNATGVAVLTEIARLAASRQLGSEVGIVVAAFGAEEKDLLGSEAYVADPTVELSRVTLMINVDMAGRRPANNPGLGYEATGPKRRWAQRLVRAAGKRARVGVISMRLGDRGDGASFSPHVPTVFFSTTVHADYHLPTDTADRVDYAQVERAARTVRELIVSLPCEGS